jgi:septal ring factor EnvC (AmiA/AmiB activator)
VLCCTQETLENETGPRIAQATKAVEELRSQLNEEQVHRRGEDRRIGVLTSTVSELQAEVDRLRAQLQDRESVQGAQRDSLAELSSQHAASKEALSHAKIQ